MWIALSFRYIPKSENHSRSGPEKFDEKLSNLSETNHNLSQSNTHHLDEVLIYLGWIGSILIG